MRRQPASWSAPASPRWPRGFASRCWPKRAVTRSPSWELSSAVDGRQPAALAQLPAVLPVSRRLLGMFGARLTALPAQTRQLLLLAALDGTGDPRIVDVAQAGQQRFDDLGPAEQAALIYVDQRTAAWCSDTR